MLKIAICNNNKSICSLVEKMLIDYSNKYGMKFEIEMFFEGDSLLKFLEQQNILDLIYLGIETGRTSGIQVGRYIRDVLKNHDVQLVYMSDTQGYEEHVINFHPLQFIVKPFNYDEILGAVTLTQHFFQKSGNFFCYQKGRVTYRVPTSEIIYFKSIGRSMEMVMVNGSETFYGTIKSAMAGVSPESFLPIHRSFLVNISHIDSIDNFMVLMSNGDALPASREKKLMLKHARTRINALNKRA